VEMTRLALMLIQTLGKLMRVFHNSTTNIVIDIIQIHVMLVIKCYLCPEAKMLPMSWINHQPGDTGYWIPDTGYRILNRVYLLFYFFYY